MARSSFWSSTIGLKVAMAVSGLVLVGFVLQHMVGNLQVFAGRDVYNAYAEFMQGLGAIKWGARFFLLGMLVVHVGAAVALTKRNLGARPQRYAGLKSQRTSPYAKTMAYTGAVVLAFIAYHLAHFTLGAVHTEHFGALDAQGRHDVYTNFVLSFQNPVIMVTYLVSTIAVAAHLAHATSSMFRTLGLSTGRLKQPIAMVGPAVGIAVALGNTAMPLACMMGIITV